MHVKKSATGSDTAIPTSSSQRPAPIAFAIRLQPGPLPARLDDARNLPGQRQLTEANAAQPEVTQIAARPPAAMATGVRAHLELRRPLPLLDQRFLGHELLPATAGGRACS